MLLNRPTLWNGINTRPSGWRLTIQQVILETVQIHRDTDHGRFCFRQKQNYMKQYLQGNYPDGTTSYMFALIEKKNVNDPCPCVQIQMKWPSHQDLHCLPFCYWFLTEPPICNNESVQIQGWKNPCQKLGVKGIKSNQYGNLQSQHRGTLGLHVWSLWHVSKRTLEFTEQNLLQENVHWAPILRLQLLEIYPFSTVAGHSWLLSERKQG